jgi:hypothetical protein
MTIVHLTLNQTCTKNSSLADLPLLMAGPYMQNLRSFPFACFLTGIVFLSLSGCKLEIRVPQGGSVVSTDGAFICEAGQTCLIDVVDLFFDETFVAEPAHGYYFRNWEERDHFLCGGESEPCRLSTADFEGSAVLQSMLESDETFFLKPRFVWTATCPEPKIVISPAISPVD